MDRLTLEYVQRRLLEEETAARACLNPAIAIVHQDFADQYRRRLQELASEVAHSEEGRRGTLWM